jgi:hypothetical protein
MILNIFRMINAAILRFVMGIKLRTVGATILGGFAGLSLTSTVIPSVMELMGIMDSFSARWELGGMAVYSVIIWAIAGRAAQRIGDTILGAVILGSSGLASGLVFTGYTIGTEAATLLVGGGTSLLYGAIGGLMITEALRNPAAVSKTPAASGQKKKKRS